MAEPRTPQPPPDLPNMPDVSTTLSDYLRRFSLWCRHGFAAKLDAQTALSGILLLSDGGAVYRLTIDDEHGPAAVVLTLVPLGSGKP